MSLKRPRTPTETRTCKRVTKALGLHQQHHDPEEVDFIETVNRWIHWKEQGDLLVLACQKWPQKALANATLIRTLVGVIDVSEWSSDIGVAAACLNELTSYCSVDQLQVLVGAYAVNLLDVMTKNVVIAQSSQLRAVSVQILGNCLRYDSFRQSFVDMGCLQLLQSVGVLANETREIWESKVDLVESMEETMEVVCEYG